MSTYDSEYKECGNVSEGLLRFSELDQQVVCPNCGSEKTERVSSIPYIESETVAGSGYGKTEFPPINPEPSKRMDRGMGGGLGKGPRDEEGLGKGWRIR